MFKKLFGRKESPTKEGKSSEVEKDSKVQWIKRFSLELSNMEGSPTYALTHQLTVGSEVGNIVIADPSVSPRHCTFLLQEDVISVMDHASVAGTFVNGQKIPGGRYIILEETDTIKIGDLEIKILVQNEKEEEIPEEDLVEEDEVEEESEPEEETEEDEEEEEESAPKEKKPSLFQRLFKKKAKGKEEKKAPAAPVKATSKKGKKGKGFSFSGNSTYATNALVRVMSVLGDVLIAYSLYVVFSPFDEFRAFVNDVPVMLEQLLDINWQNLWSVVNEEQPFVGEMLKDLYSFLSVTFQIGPFLLLFIMIRLVTTLLFGVSISEAALGVRSHGNGFWKRIGGVLRVVIGIVTGPLIIFDVPAIVSRRTFKEFMTFTHTYTPSKAMTIFGFILYLPLLLAIGLLCPLIQGLEVPEPIAINTKPDRRIKVVQPEGIEEVQKVKEFSKFMHLELEYDNQSVSLIPSFKFSGQAKKLNFRPALAFYHRELQRTVNLEVFKTFDMRELLSIGMKNNFFLYEKYPEIYNFVYASEGMDPSFKSKIDEKSSHKFADEVVNFTKKAFELNANNALDYMQTYTPLLKGLMDYRSSFLALIEYKEFDQIDFVKIGNAYFLRISYIRQKPFDLVIPLIKGEGKIIRIDFDKKENLNVLTSKFYKFTVEGANWFPKFENEAPGEVLKPLQILDFFAKLDLNDYKINPDTAQGLYGFYFEKSGEVLKKDDAIEYELWKKSVDSIFTIMEKMKDSIPKTVEQLPAPTTEPTPETTPEDTTDAPVDTSATTSPDTAPTDTSTAAPVEAAPVEDPRMKLFQNFQDLKDAIENKNQDYFGGSESVNI